MNLRIRQAGAKDVDEVSGILREAASWLEQQGKTLWRDNELLPEKIREEVEAGLFHLAEINDEVAGVIRFQLEDQVMWPEARKGEAAYIHRLAVRRKYAGGQVSNSLLNWAIETTRALGLPYLRMDTEANRLRLRAIYEGYGFRFHSERQVGPYLIARYELSIP